MSQPTYLKIPFVWEEPRPLVEVPSRLEFATVETSGYEVLLATVAEVMEASLDASDRKQVAEQGSRQAAEAFLANAQDGFSYPKKMVADWP